MPIASQRDLQRRIFLELADTLGRNQEFCAVVEGHDDDRDTQLGSVMGGGRSRQAFYALIVLKTRQLTRKTLAWTGRHPLLVGFYDLGSCFYRGV